jgi:hypothetical protein
MLKLTSDEPFIEAAMNNHKDVLAFLLAHFPDTSAEVLSSMLNAAGANDHLATAQWLRQQGAEWPSALLFTSVCGWDWVEWSGETLAWARAEGCTSPTELKDASDSEVNSDNEGGNNDDF